ncbi:MAG: hypothetical protein C0511_10605 [Hyphomicrobium sp.]|nr:hypothetical protein [Hyphomicrobium sp.]PPC81592.1 MAG: hypothetical protein CTY40_06705 [Hyphomicrobium sp.]
MYEIPKVAFSVAGDPVTKAAESKRIDDLIDLLGVQDYLAISGVDVSAMQGMSVADVAAFLARHNIDTARLDRDELVRLALPAAG